MVVVPLLHIDKPIIICPVNIVDSQMELQKMKMVLRTIRIELQIYDNGSTK